MYHISLKKMLNTYSSKQLKQFDYHLRKDTVPDYNISANIAFLHPLQTQVYKNPYKQNNRPLSREYTTTLLFTVSHLTGVIFTFKN